jgi:DNA-binding PadR family transcriptional regulator
MDSRTGKSMSTIDMVILGILQIKPMNPYELTRYVESHQVHRLLKISKPSIYKTCKRLYQERHLSGRAVREGENPEKMVYSITKRGKKYFLALMEHFSGELHHFYFEFNSFIWNLERLEPRVALEMLRNLENALRQLGQGIEIHEREVSGAPFPVRMIVKQYRMTIRSMVDWIAGVIVEFKREYRV